MDCKFARDIHRVHPNKCPLKILEKRERGRIHGLPKVLSTPIMPGTGKLGTSNFVRTFTVSM